MPDSFLLRPLAITDIESTGTDHTRHEIVDIGLVLLDPRTLETISEWSVKVRPEHPEDHPEPAAIAVSGYAPELWKDAMPLSEAIRAYIPKVEGAVFTGWNVTFDWRFMDAAFRKTAQVPTLDYHRLCIFSMAYDRLHAAGLDSYSLDGVAKHFGLPGEPRPHLALNGARRAAEILRLLRAMDAR